MIAMVLGFGAISVDLAWLRIADAHLQDVADAASQAAVIVLRSSGDEDAATAAAQGICERNPVAGAEPTLDSIEFGTWDDATSTFTAGTAYANAARVTVSRKEANGVGVFLARIFGWDHADLDATATSAGRSLQVCLAMDITNSWNRPEYYNARDAAVAFLDTMEGAYGDDDMIGMTIFTGRYAWEFSPMTYVKDEVVAGTLRADWEAMETGSKAGKPTTRNRHHCKVYSKRSGKQDDFSHPAGGCFPNMPREYSDEPGTDHTAGVALCRQMFEELPDAGAFRAMVVLTDGKPNGTRSGHGRKRAKAGYTETRWREYRAPVPHSTSAIKRDVVKMTEDMWTDLEVHTWVVSFVKDDAFMEDMVQGYGYYANTSDSSELVDIFEDIAQSLPIAIVE